MPALLPCLRALFDFQRSYGQLPDIGNTQHLRDFTNLATNKSRELQLPPETLRAEFLRSFIQNIGAEIVPTAAFVGGRLSEDVINVLGKREQPIQNFALFDGDSLEGRIYSLYSPPPEATLPIGMDMGMPMNGMMDPMAAGMDGMGMMMNNGMMGASGMGGFGMMQDGGMMDGSGMVGLNNGMDSGMGGMVGAPEMGMGNGVPDVPTSETTVESGTQVVAQDPPRSVPDGEA